VHLHVPETRESTVIRAKIKTQLTALFYEAGKNHTIKVHNHKASSRENTIIRANI